MRTPRRCHSYLPGHQTHPIAALRVYARTPRDPVTVLDVDAKGWITFRQRGRASNRWWHHDASRIAALWRAGARFKRVRGSHFLLAELTEGRAYWQYCDDSPSPCVNRPSADPTEAIRNEGGFLAAVAPRKMKASTEAITTAMAAQTLTKAQLARRLGKTPGFVTQILSGGRNLTLATIADVCDALRQDVHIELVPSSRAASERPRRGPTSASSYRPHNT